MLQLHHLKMVHRDIKLSNFVFSEERRRYVFCDFGLSHAIRETPDEETVLNGVGGTLGYVSEKMKRLMLMKK